MSTHPAPKSVLMVVANPAISSTLGWPVGFWASELTHPFLAFQEAGYAITIASPDGGKVAFDAMSDPRDDSGYAKDDFVSMGFIHTPDLMAQLEDTPALADLDPSAYDAVVVCGGQAPMFTFAEATDLHQTVEAFYTAGKPTAALCHGVAALLYVKDADGQPLIAGKTLTGFANSEEDYADQVVGQQVMPFRIEDEAKKLGANYVSKGAFAPFAIRDGHLITGQQQNSGRATAALVIEALGH